MRKPVSEPHQPDLFRTADLAELERKVSGALVTAPLVVVVSFQDAERARPDPDQEYPFLQMEQARAYLERPLPRGWTLASLFRQLPGGARRRLGYRRPGLPYQQVRKW